MTRSWILVAILALSPASAFAAGKILRGVGFDESLSGDAVLAEALRQAKGPLNGMPLNVRLIVQRSEIEPRPAVYDFAALDARLARYRAVAGVQIYLDLRDAEPSPDGLEAWGRLMRAVAARYRGAVRGYVFGVRSPEAAAPAAREHAFFVKTTTINLRVGDGDAATILGGVRNTDAEWLSSLYAEDVAAYVDAIGIDAASPSAAILALVEHHDPTSDVAVLGDALGDNPAEGARRFIERHLGVLGTRVAGVTYTAPVPVAAAALSPVAFLRAMLEQDLVTVDETVAKLRLARGDEDVTATVAHQLLFGLGSFRNYLIYSGAQEALQLTMSESTGARPTIADALRGTRAQPRSFTYDTPTTTARMELPADPGTLIVDWSGGASAGYTAREEVASTVLPSVAEIISRHQQAQAAHDALLTSYIVNANMEQHFRTTSIDPGFDVMTENRMFVEGKNTEWEEVGFRLNGTKWGPKRPPFPLLQAEKVLSLPFDLRLDSDYRYQLVGVEEVAGRPCFQVRFDPVDEARSLYQGTVWIDRETYLNVKAQTVQTRLSAPVVSSEEIQYFTPVGTIDGHEIHLLTRLVGRQILLVAGRNLLVERGIHFEAFRLNPATFAAEREAARGTDHVMYRDTDEGLRYLVKKDGSRVVQGATTSALAGLIGITYDPAYDYPLPLAGINYLDFDFLGKSNQLALVFGGVLAIANVQRPKLIGRHVDGSLDVFAIAVKSNDRTYDLDGELTGQRLMTLPFSTGINLGWQVSPFQKLTANYQFQFNAFSADDLTAPTFRVPMSTITNGLGLSWELKQGGYSLVAGGASYSRLHWEPWGDADDYRSTDQHYVKYSVSLTKDFFFGLQKIHLNSAYYGGRDLDRFSAYQFGFYDDNRIHGVPSTGVRFGELAMFRAGYSFNLFDQYRLDLFLDHAYGRDHRLTTDWQRVTGVGIGGTLRGPMNTLLRGEAGKSFLPSQYRRPGSLVVQIQVLKPL
ncbi:MAG: sigma-E factor regulatory protein RseB domain-containing protein [Vicinamibacterales bacterium]